MISQRGLVLIIFILIYLQIEITYWNNFNSIRRADEQRSKYFDDQIEKISHDLKISKRFLKKIKKEYNKTQTITDKINKHLTKSSVQYSSEQDTIKLRNDFEKFDTNFINLKNISKQYKKGAVAVDATIIWCSQQVSGQFSIGSSSLINFNIENNLKNKNWEWNSIDEINSLGTNEWSTFTIHNEKMCRTQNSKINLMKGGFLMKSEGFGDRQNMNTNDSNQSGRESTEITIVIRGFQVEYKKYESKN